MKSVFVNNAFFRILWPAFYGAMIYLIILMVFDNIAQLTVNFFNQEMWFCVGLSYFFFESIRLEITFFQKFKVLKQQMWMWITSQMVMSILVSLVIISGALSIYFIKFIGYSFGTFDTELITFNVIFAVTSILYNMIFFGVYFLNEKNEALLSRENTIRKNLELQIQSFNNDINPRFLYSCLETLITLLYKKGRESEQFVARLSSIYRYILQNKHNELSPVSAEINSIDDLIYLFNSRQTGKITLSADINEDTDGDKQMITGTLSAVVEDIVNNTIISNEQSLHISCEMEDDDYFVVKNKINDRLLVDENSRKRCESLKEAYSYLTSQPFFQVKAYNESFVKIPLISL